MILLIYAEFTYNTHDVYNIRMIYTRFTHDTLDLRVIYA
jgi:hypothetical protein